MILFVTGAREGTSLGGTGKDGGAITCFHYGYI